MFKKNISVLLSCEHAVHIIPPTYSHLFSGSEEILLTHRGYDLFAKEIAEEWQLQTQYPLFCGEYSRLLIDLNRSVNQQDVFSEFTRVLSSHEKQSIIQTYYQPHRQKIVQHIQKEIAIGQDVLHLGIHSFTPNFNGKERTGEIGILFDPRRDVEAMLAKAWRYYLQPYYLAKNVRLNYPYLGTDDGLTTTCRKRFSANHYFGLEIEFNQRFLETIVKDQRTENFVQTLQITFAKAVSAVI